MLYSLHHASIVCRQAASRTQAQARRASDRCAESPRGGSAPGGDRAGCGLCAPPHRARAMPDTTEHGWVAAERGRGVRVCGVSTSPTRSRSLAARTARLAGTAAPSSARSASCRARGSASSLLSASSTSPMRLTLALALARATPRAPNHHAVARALRASANPRIRAIASPSDLAERVSEPARRRRSERGARRHRARADVAFALTADAPGIGISRGEKRCQNEMW